MNLRNLDLNLLVSFDALFAERSVSKAAKKVFLSQPGMSCALARLRNYFGDELLVQRGREMVPTPMAEYLARPVRDALLQLQSIATSTVSFDPARSDRTIIMLASDYMGTVLLRKVVQRVSREAPGMRVELRWITQNYREEFERGHADFIFLPTQYIFKDHPSDALFEDKYTCVVWSKNSEIRGELSSDEYMNASHVCVDLGGGRIPTYDEWFLNQYPWRKRRVAAYVPHWGMALQFITGTPWVGTIHLRLAEMFAKQFSLRLVKPPSDIPVMKYQMQWHKHNNLDPSLKWFRELTKAVAGEME
jgi:DNA-binding transcriptional LysR family regulator